MYNLKKINEFIVMHIHPEYILTEYPEISEFVILETRKVCEIFDDFINEMVPVIINVKKETTFDVEAARYYADNLWFTGYCYDNKNKAVKKTTEDNFHPIYFQFHPQLFDGYFVKTPIEFNFTKEKSDFNLYYEANQYMSVRIRSFEKNDEHEKIIIDIFLKNYSSYLTFLIKSHLGHECDHIIDMWNDNSLRIDSDTAYRYITFEYFKESGIDLSIYKNCIDIIKFVKDFLYAFSNTEMNTIHKQIDNFCKECKTEILLNMTKMSFRDKNDLVRKFADKYAYECGFQFKARINLLEQLKNFLKDKEILPIILVMTECVKYDYYVDIHNMLQDYTLAKQIMSGEYTFDKKLYVLITRFINHYEIKLNNYIRDVKKTIYDALVEHDLIKPVMLNENMQYNDNIDYSYFVTENIIHYQHVYGNLLREKVKSGEIIESEMWRFLTINDIEQDMLLWFSNEEHPKILSEIYYEIY